MSGVLKIEIVESEKTLKKLLAQHTGTTKRTVHQVISDYNRQGVKAMETPGKGGRRRGYLSLAEEKKFLAQFMDSAIILITGV